jgi:hypothetical protein
VLSAHLLDCIAKDVQPAVELTGLLFHEPRHPCPKDRGSTGRWTDPSRSAANTMPPPTGECFAGSVTFGGPVGRCRSSKNCRAMREWNSVSLSW